MKTTILLLGFILFTASSFGQSSLPRNLELIKIADSLYGAEDYKSSAFAYSEAFKANGWNATSNEHYNAACSWALANYPDSAFYHLNYIATKMNYTDYGHIKGDPDFKSLYHDARWQNIIELVKTNKDIAYSNIDFITVNGFKTEVLTSGMQNSTVNKPVVVFENGLASGFGSWDTVFEEISKTNTVFRYNRPRIGESEDDSLPPTTAHIVNNLRKMLLQKGFKPPYLLVSHSFGGAYLRSFASMYPNEIAGLVFVDPVDFTKEKGFGSLPYLEIGLTQFQIDSMFGEPKDKFIEQLYEEMPGFYVEEVKILRALTATGFEECVSNPLPNVPVHFIMAGGYPATPDDPGDIIIDKVKLFRINNNIQMKRWLELIDPLQYGKFFYSSSSGHLVQVEDPELVISSIKLALRDYDKIQQTHSGEDNDRKEVVEVLQQFQDGYTNRDITIIDEFLEMFTDDIVYMGVASHEFFKGKESVHKLTLWDWKSWFDLKIPVAEVDIRINNDVAWFEVVGESGPWRNGNTYEIRMVGSLIKKDKWLFKQICFSYPAPLKEVKK